MSGGYYVQTDLMTLDIGGKAWITEDEMQVAHETMGTPFGRTLRGERFYWNGEKKTMDGAVERATVYPTVEEAESEALIAACLDPDLAGHVHIVPELEALALERPRIEARRIEEANARLHAQNRFKLGSREGGI